MLIPTPQIIYMRPTELIAKPSGALRGQQPMALISSRETRIRFSQVIFFKIQMYWKNLQIIQALRFMKSILKLALMPGAQLIKLAILKLLSVKQEDPL